MQKSKISKRITQLDGLRGVAALMVLALHFPIKESFFTNNFLVRQSWLFVDFFFCLSGFIIATNYYFKINNWYDLKSYIFKRIARLLPLLYFTVGIYFIYEMVGLFLNLKVNPQPIVFYIKETLDSLTLLNSTTLLGSTQGMNPPSWSISAEMISYLVFGLGIIIFPKKKIYVSILTIFLCISLMILNDNYAFQNGDYGFVRGLLGFNLGVITYLLSKIKNYKTNFFEIPTLLILIYTLYFTFNNKNEFSNIQYIVVPFIFSLNVYIFSLSSGFFSTILSSNIFQFFGKLSYSIYLNHYLILMIIYQIAFNFFEIEMIEPYISLVFLLSIIVVIVSSIFTHKYVENFIGTRLRKYLLK